MELDDLKQAWQALGRRLQQQNVLQLALLHEQHVGRMRTRLHMPALGQAAQVALGLCLAWMLPVTQWSSMPMPLMAAGAIFLVYGMLIAIFGVNALVRMRRIDPHASVSELQLRMLQLRKAMLVSHAVAGLPWCVLWLVPIGAAMATQSDAGFASDASAWRWLNLALGIALLLGALAFWRWVHRPGREAFATRLHDLLAGRSLRRAQAELDELKRFMAE